MSEDNVITQLSEDRVREIVREEFAPLLDAINELRDEIKRVDTDRRASANLDANERQDLRAQLKTVLDIVNSNAVGVAANRENIFTVQKSMQDTLDQLRHSTLDANAALVTLTGRLRNAESRQNTLVSRLEWHDKEAAETRKIAEAAAGESVRLGGDLSDVFIRMGEIARTVEKLALMTQDYDMKLKHVVEIHQPLVEFAEIAKERAERWRQWREQALEAVKTRPGRAAVIALVGSASGLGLAQIIEFLSGLF